MPFWWNLRHWLRHKLSLQCIQWRNFPQNKIFVSVYGLYILCLHEVLCVGVCIDSELCLHPRGYNILLLSWYVQGVPICFQSGFRQCANLMKNNSVSGDRKSRELVLISHTKTSTLVLLYDLRVLMGNISSMMTKHIAVQRRLPRFVYPIIQIILYNWL